MNLSLWLSHALPLAGVVFVVSITPGPNNVMVMSSGHHFGVRQTVPHLLGIATGFVGLLLLVYAGVGSMVQQVPGFSVVLTFGCSAYLLWLAWHLFRSQPSADSAVPSLSRRPWRFLEAAAFQFVNPKGLAVAATCAGIATELPGSTTAQMLTLAGVGAFVNLPCVWVWAALGTATQRWLKSTRAHQVFYSLMALFLVFSVIWMLEDLL